MIDKQILWLIDHVEFLYWQGVPLSAAIVRVKNMGDKQ